MSEKHFGCVGNTIKLRSGRYFDLVNPRPEQFTLSDIAGALAKICRFGGQCLKFYSVAEHSVHCATQASKDGHDKYTQAAALLHDAAEAFIGDCVKPLKIMLPEYFVIEDRIEKVIEQRFGVNFTSTREIVKEIDNAMLIAERHRFMRSDDYVWDGEAGVRKLDVRWACLSPVLSEFYFLNACERLGLVQE